MGERANHLEGREAIVRTRNKVCLVRTMSLFPSSTWWAPANKAAGLRGQLVVPVLYLLQAVVCQCFTWCSSGV